MKAKVIELVGQKLDPNAKYLILYHAASINPDTLIILYEELSRLIGENRFVLAPIKGNPNESTKIYEFVQPHVVIQEIKPVVGEPEPDEVGE